MSKVVLQGNNSGGGTFTVTSPDSNSNRTVTLPDSTGTLDTIQRAGNVLQVVQGTLTTSFTTTSQTFVDSGITATITPSSTSSKIRVDVDYWSYFADGNDRGACQGNILRGSTEILERGYYINTGVSDVINYMEGVFSMSIVDSPSTTSSITYKVQIKGSENSTAGLYAGPDSPAVIILTEIAG